MRMRKPAKFETTLRNETALKSPESEFLRAEPHANRSSRGNEESCAISMMKASIENMREAEARDTIAYRAPKANSRSAALICFAESSNSSSNSELPLRYDETPVIASDPEHSDE
eukprot:Amastigsp_a844673_16.p3 type:complete len:114 gc:universal Amastigsp_a844673_16:204-545(+)